MGQKGLPTQVTARLPRGTRLRPLPLLPPGPDGVGGRPLRRTRLSLLSAKTRMKGRINGGEGGIRTLGTLRYTRFPIVHLRPLGHLSAGWEEYNNYYGHVKHFCSLPGNFENSFRKKAYPNNLNRLHPLKNKDNIAHRRPAWQDTWQHPPSR